MNELEPIKRNIGDLMDAQIQIGDALEDLYERVAGQQRQMYFLLGVIVVLSSIIVSGYI